MQERIRELERQQVTSQVRIQSTVQDFKQSQIKLVTNPAMVDLEILQEENVRLTSQVQVLTSKNAHLLSQISQFDEKLRQNESKFREQTLILQLEAESNFKKVEQDNVRLLSQVEVYQRTQANLQEQIDDYLAQIEKLNQLNAQLQAQLINISKDQTKYYRDQDAQIEKLTQTNQSLIAQIGHLTNQHNLDLVTIQDLQVIKATQDDQIRRLQDELSTSLSRVSGDKDQTSQLAQLNQDYLNQNLKLQNQISELQKQIDSVTSSYEDRLKQALSQVAQTSNQNKMSQQQQIQQQLQQIDDLNARIAQLTAQISNLNLQKNSLNSELLTLKQQLSMEQAMRTDETKGYLKQIEQLRQQLDLKSSKSMDFDKIDRLESDNQALEERLSLQATQLQLAQRKAELYDQLKRDFDKLESENKALKKQVDTLKQKSNKDIEDVRYERMSLQNDYETEIRRYQNYEKEFKSLKTKYEQLQKDKSLLEGDKESLASQNSHKEREIKLLKRKIESFEQEQLNKSLNTSVDDSKNRQILELEQKNTRLTKQLDQLKQQYEDEKSMLYREIEQLTEQKKQKRKPNQEEELRRLEQENSKLSERLSLDSQRQERERQSIINERQLLIQKYDQENAKLQKEVQQLRLSENEARSSLKQIDVLQVEYVRATQTIQQLQQRIEYLETENLRFSKDSTEIENRNREIVKLEDQVRKLERLLEQSRQQIALVSQEKQQLVNEVNRLQNKPTYDQEVRKLEMENAHLKERLSTELESKTYEIERLQQQRQSLQSTCEEKVMLLRKYEGDNNALKQELERQSHTVETQRQNSEIENRNSIRKMDQLQADLVRANQTIKLLQQKIEDLELDNLRVSKDSMEMESRSRQIIDLEEKIKMLNRQVEQQKAQNNALSLEKQKMFKEIDQLHQQLNEQISQRERTVQESESKISKETQRYSLQLNDQAMVKVQLESRIRQLQDQLQLQERNFEQKLKEANDKIIELEDDLAVMIDNVKKEQRSSLDWETQYRNLKTASKDQVDDVRVRTELIFKERLQLIEEEASSERQLLNSEIRQLKNEIEVKNKRISSLESQSQLESRNRSREYENTIAQLRQQIKEQEDRISELLSSEFDSMKHKPIDQVVVSLMNEIKILQQKLSKYESYIRDLEDQFQQVASSEDQLVAQVREMRAQMAESKTTNLGDSQNVKIISLEKQLANVRQDLQQRSAVGEQLQRQNDEMYEEITILVERVRELERENAGLNGRLRDYQKEVSFMKDVVREDTLDQSTLDEKNRKIIELENKCALLANENSRLNQMKVTELRGQVRQVNEWRQKYEELQKEAESVRGLEMRGWEDTSGRLGISSKFGQISTVENQLIFLDR